MKPIQELITEIDEIIDELGAKLPASPAGPENIKLADKLQRDLSDYFKFMVQAFPFGEIERLYNKYVEQP